MDEGDFSSRIGELLIRQRPGSLVIERSRRNGCGAAFIGLWLFGWTYGLVRIASEPMTGASWNALVFMGLPELVVLAVFIHQLTGRERLIVDQRWLTWERAALVRFDHRQVAAAEVQAIDLLPLDPGTSKDGAVGIMVIKGHGSEIRFGRGLSGDELHKLLPLVRGFVEGRGIPIAPPESAPQVPPLTLAESLEEKRNEPESRIVGFFRWLTVPFFVFVGVLMLLSGVGLIRSGHVLGVVFGLFFTGVGFILSVGLTVATISVFIGWVRRLFSGAKLSPERAGDVAVTVQPEMSRRQPAAPAPQQLTKDVTPDPPHKRTAPIWLAMVALLAGTAISVILRVRVTPWDFGGIFFHVWVSIVALSILWGLSPRLKGMARVIAAFAIAAGGAGMQIGSVFFAPQVLFPFLLITGLIVGACYLWSCGRTGVALLAAMALVPTSGSVFFYSLPHMRQVLRLRALGADEITVAEVIGNYARDSHVIRDPRTLAQIAAALHDMSPYSPNHEGISQERRLKLRLVDGSGIEFSVGKGNRANPNTVWIEFGVEVYQSPGLLPVLEEQRVFSSTQPGWRE